MKMRWIAAIALLAGAMGIAADQAPTSMLPDVQKLPGGGDYSKSELSAGTPAMRGLQMTPTRSAVRVAILGDAVGAGGADLAKLVGELNEVSPDFVVTAGGLVRGANFLRDVGPVRQAMNKLTMPWYPCVNFREGAPEMFEDSYGRSFGPRYFSVDLGDVHVIALDSEEVSGAVTISDAQLLWLAKDLDKAFRRARHVAVVMHRPAWRDEKSNWETVHQMLAAFGKRPVVAIEGEPNSNVRGGKVEAVFASAAEYCEDDARDGVRMITVGPVKGTGTTAMGRMGQIVTARIGGDSIGVSVIETGRTHGADLVTKKFREAMEKIEKAGVIGVEGSVEISAGAEAGTQRADEGTVWLAISNPLEVPLRVKAKLADGCAWKLTGVEREMVVKPGENLRVRVGLSCVKSDKDLWPPEIIFSAVVDEKGREVEVRRVVKMKEIEQKE